MTQNIGKILMTSIGLSLYNAHKVLTNIEEHANSVNKYWG